MTVLDIYTGRAWRSLQPSVIAQVGSILPISGLSALEARLPIAVIDRGGPIDRFFGSARFSECGWTIVVGRVGDVEITAPTEVAEAWARAGGDPACQDAVRAWWRRYVRINLVHELTARLLTDLAEESWLDETHRLDLERLDERDGDPESRPGARF